LPDTGGLDIDQLTSLHVQYDNLFVQAIEHMNIGTSSSAEYDGEIKKTQEELIHLIKNISSQAHKAQYDKTIMTSRIGTSAFRVTVVLCIIGVLLSFSATVLITRNIARPISQLKLATNRISEGKFDHVPDVKNRDELGDLSVSFTEMAVRLKRLEEMYLDAHPLTRLPGSIAIENVLTKRLETGSPMAFCLIDLDNFKAFNDRYGYAQGSEVIKATAKIVIESVAENGVEEDFVGHIGGDDFVVITSPERYVKISNAVIEAFDKKIPEFYDKNDLLKGYIHGRTRQGQEAKFPIMTISIAVVTNEKRELLNAIQVGEIAAELKDYAKSLPRSIYVVDKRRKEFSPSTPEKIIQFPQRASGQEEV
jgi:diguanylate cyclase (GGDEF)-like protein